MQIDREKKHKNMFQGVNPPGHPAASTIIQREAPDTFPSPDHQFSASEKLR